MAINGDFQGFSLGEALPATPDVASLETADPVVRAALGPSTNTILGYVNLSNVTPSIFTSTISYNERAAFTFDMSAFSPGQHLLVGLLSSTATTEAYFEDLRMTIYAGGTQFLTPEFVSLGSALSYFSDHVIDLGPVITSGSNFNISISMNYQSAGGGDGFDANLIFGTAAPAAPTPEPSTWMCVGIGAALLLNSRRKMAAPGHQAARFSRGGTLITLAVSALAITMTPGASAQYFSRTATVAGGNSTESITGTTFYHSDVGVLSYGGPAAPGVYGGAAESLLSYTGTGVESFTRATTQGGIATLVEAQTYRITDVTGPAAFESRAVVGAPLSGGTPVGALQGFTLAEALPSAPNVAAIEASSPLVGAALDPASTTILGYARLEHTTNTSYFSSNPDEEIAVFTFDLSAVPPGQDLLVGLLCATGTSTSPQPGYGFGLTFASNVSNFQAESDSNVSGVLAGLNDNVVDLGPVGDTLQIKVTLDCPDSSPGNSLDASLVFGLAPSVPVPEPAAWVSLMAGTACVYRVSRRRLRRP